MSTVESIAFYNRMLRQYQDNIGYRTANSIAMARLLIEAVDGMLINPIEVSAGGTSGERVRFEHESKLAARREAAKWISQRNIAANQFTHFQYCPE